MSTLKKKAHSAATETHLSKNYLAKILVTSFKRERKERVFRARSRLLHCFVNLPIPWEASFTLTELAAPLGVLGADVGASYGGQKPQVSSCLLPLHTLPKGRHCLSVSPPSPYVSLRYGTRASRNVTIRRALNKSLYLSYRLCALPHPLSLGTEASRSGATALKLKLKLRPRPSMPPLKPKRQRREATQLVCACACASMRALFVSNTQNPKRGVFVTPPSRITWA